MTKFVIIGSGVIALYTIYELLEKKVDPDQIFVLAEHLPGDESINYTSPNAGGNFSCISGDDEDTLSYDKYTYLSLSNLRSKLGNNCGLERCYSTEYWDTKPSPAKLNSLKSYLEDFRVIDSKSLIPGVECGIRYKSWSFNCPLFLRNFMKYLEQKGVRFEKRKLTHIAQAFGHDTKYVFNCTGLGALKLGGVTDTNVYPTRGQVLIVQAPHIQENVMRWGDNYATYIIKRPNSNDQLVLGGFLEKNNWNPDSTLSQSKDILERTCALLPKILTDNPFGPKLENINVLKTGVGLRPSRYGGVRIEREEIEHGKTVIHNYGASGYGYQAGLGMAKRGVCLAFRNDCKL